MNSRRRCFGIIPAAGRSRRMGTHKLLLSGRGATVIEHVLEAWTRSRVARTVVIVRQDDTDLQAVVDRQAIDLVIPEHDPQDMKQSIQLGLRHIIATYDPSDTDRWLVAPADLPTITSTLIDRVIEAGTTTDTSVAPRFGDRSGHPVSFPWSLVRQAFELKSDQGINRLLEIAPVAWLQMPESERPYDIDTREDYHHFRQESANESS